MQIRKSRKHAAQAYSGGAVQAIFQRRPRFLSNPSPYRDAAFEYEAPPMRLVSDQTDAAMDAYSKALSDVVDLVGVIMRALPEGSAGALLVDSTGGLAFYPKDVTQVEQIAHEVAHDIRNQYTITYTPTNQALDGSFRPIKVSVKSSGTAVARTRMGYYATKDRGAAKSGF